MKDRRRRSNTGGKEKSLKTLNLSARELSGKKGEATKRSGKKRHEEDHTYSVEHLGVQTGTEKKRQTDHQVSVLAKVGGKRHPPPTRLQTPIFAPLKKRGECLRRPCEVIGKKKWETD